ARGIRRFVVDHRNENIFFGVASRLKSGNGTLENCADLHALWIDLDFKTPGDLSGRRRRKAFPPPSIVVSSGGGRHAYWLLKEPIDLRRDAAHAKNLLQRLAAALGGDPRAAEPARILRVPGSLNHKYQPARPVQVLEAKAARRRYSLADIEKALPP